MKQFLLLLTPSAFWKKKKRSTWLSFFFLVQLLIMATPEEERMKRNPFPTRRKQWVLPFFGEIFAEGTTLFRCISKKKMMLTGSTFKKIVMLLDFIIIFIGAPAFRLTYKRFFVRLREILLEVSLFFTEWEKNPDFLHPLILFFFSVANYGQCTSLLRLSPTS